MGQIKKTYPCVLELTHDIIGGKWKLRILWHIAHGNDRFSLLVKAIPDITQKVLTEKLKQLEESGVLVKTIVDNKPPKVILYRIAPEYNQLYELMEQICDFTRGYAKNHHIVVEDE